MDCYIKTLNINKLLVILYHFETVLVTMITLIKIIQSRSDSFMFFYRPTHKPPNVTICVFDIRILHEYVCTYEIYVF